MSEHLLKLRAFLRERQLDCIVINDLKNVRYFSGFAGSAAVLTVTEKKALLYTDFRYLEQAKEEATTFEIVKHGEHIYRDVADAIQVEKNIAFEKNYVTVETLQRMQEFIPDKNWCGVKLGSIRMIKDEKEIGFIEQAVKIADNAFARLLLEIKEGMSEIEAAALLEFFLKEEGATRTSFPTIVASGKRSSLPHGQPTQKKFDRGDFVTFDFGAIYQGYCSDITRTVVIGSPSDKQREIYDIVLAAQLAAISKLRPGITGKEGDSYARAVIKNAGYDEMFGHGTGHSLGINIHEEPRLSPNCDTILCSGMVLTVEPGIYIPDWGGVRIEDVVVITNEGVRILTKTDKKLIEI